MALDILIVDDEADIRNLTSGILEDEGFQTREAADGAEALDNVEGRVPGLVLLDIWLQGSELDGLDLLRVIKKNHPSVPIVMMSGHGTIETAVTAIKEGAYDFSRGLACAVQFPQAQIPGFAWSMPMALSKTSNRSWSFLRRERFQFSQPLRSRSATHCPRRCLCLC